MRFLVVLFLFCVPFTWAYNGTDEGFIGWHQKVGIKDAERLKKVEDYLYLLDRIVGGTIAPVHAHPYLAGILVTVQGLAQPSACGGSLLSSNRVLTAAHCWFDGRFQAQHMTVVLGSPYLFHGGLRTPISAIAIHGQYDPRTFANDIAMLHLPIHVPFSQTIRPINLPTGQLLDMDFTGLWARAAGYGRYSDVTNPTTNTVVRNVIVPVITLEECRRVYGNVILDSNMCTNGYGGVGICQGDSGGPLTVISQRQDILIGISSFVARDGCQLGHPSVFARISSFVDWINHHL